ncbi:MAG: hypothetical protein HQ538_02545 [Parcubacteria group bacterium]|nr:hypothetical protein [Parcubacteria group bacterium]
MRRREEGLMPLHEVQPDSNLRKEKDYEGEKLKRVLESRGTREDGQNVSEGDLFFVPSEIEENELLDLISDKFDVENIEEAIPEINKHFHEARKFMTEYLRLRLPDKIKNIKKIEKDSDVLNFMRNTRALKSRRPSQLTPYYCALSFLVLAENEFDNANMESFIKESEYLYERLFKEDQDGVLPFFPKLTPDKEYEEFGVLADGSTFVENVNITFRGKNKESVIAKLVRNPEVDANEVIQDGIGLKFEARTDEDALRLLEFLSKYFKNNLQARDLVVQNVGYLCSEEEEILRDEFKDLGISVISKDNDTSNRNFKSLKLRGKISLPKGGKEDSVEVNRSFEIQVVTAGNENERGMANHSIYKGVQKLSAFTRLFGSFTEYYLCLISKEASKETGLGEDKIKEYIKNNFLSEIVVKNGAKKPIKRYGFTKQLDRLSKAGMLPKGFEYMSVNGNNKGKD